MNRMIAGMIGFTAMCGTAHAQNYEPAIAPAPPPTTANPANVGAWPVGLWTRGGCSGAAAWLRLHKDGRYERTSDAGTWRIVKNEIVLSYRLVGPNATSDMERRAPIASKRIAFAKVSPERMTLGGASWARCSRDPDFYLQ